MAPAAGEPAAGRRLTMLRGSRPWRAALAGAAAMLLAAVAVAVAAPAAAEPATTVRYPAWASATSYTGLAFDACTAPSIADMRRGRRRHTTPLGSTWAGRTAPVPSPS